jgi:hypothetical protein
MKNDRCSRWGRALWGKDEKAVPGDNADPCCNCAIVREWLGPSPSAANFPCPAEISGDAAHGLEQLGFVWHCGHRR